MSFAVKNRIEFCDLRQLTWRIDILKNGYSGSITTLKAAANPLNIEFDSGSDVFSDPLKPSTATMRVFATTDFQLADLYSTEDLHYLVKIYYNDTTLFWQGWLRMDDFEEAYDDTPYEVTIKAECGLNYLKNVEYKDGDGEFYTGRKTIAQIIFDIFDKINYTNGFKEFVNIYDTGISSGTNNSIFDQVYIDAEVFQEKNCYEVLESILTGFDATMLMKEGVFHIYRAKELTGATVYGRYFTSATSKTSTSISPAQYIKRTGYSSDLIQMPGGKSLIIAPASTVECNQDYGYKESWIKNWQFKAETFSYSGGYYETKYWTRAGISYFYPLNTLLKEEKDGIAFTTYIPSGAGYSNYFYQSFGTYAKASTKALGFEFQMCCISNGSFNNAKLYIEVKSDNRSYYLTNDTNLALKWSTTSAKIQITHNVTAGDFNWQKISYSIPSLPISGTYTIKIFTQTQSTNYYFIGIKDIKFFQTADTIFYYKTRLRAKLFNKWTVWRSPWRQRTKYVDEAEVVQKTYTVDNGINGKKMEFNYLIGDVVDSNVDNIPEQFCGALTYAAMVKDYDKCYPLGTLGSLDITAGGVTRRMYFDINMEETCMGFYASYVIDYAAAGITLNYGYDGNYYVSFQAAFEMNTSWSPVSGDVSLTISTITNYSTGHYPTSSWSSRGGSEADSLIEFVANEIALQYSRPKQMLSIPIADLDDSGVGFNLLGCLQDNLNKYDGNNRNFVFSRGNFDLYNRIYDIDLIEIV